MVEAKLIYAVIIFVGILFTITTTATLETAKLSGFVNSTDNENITFLTSGNTILDPPLCVFEGTFVDQGFTIVQCVGDYIGFSFGFIALQSENVFLGIPFLAIAVLMIFIAIGLIARIATAVIPF